MSKSYFPRSWLSDQSAHCIMSRHVSAPIHFQFVKWWCNVLCELHPKVLIGLRPAIQGGTCALVPAVNLLCVRDNKKKVFIHGSKYWGRCTDNLFPNILTRPRSSSFPPWLCVCLHVPSSCALCVCVSHGYLRTFKKTLKAHVERRNYMSGAFPGTSCYQQQQKTVGHCPFS